MVSRYVSNGYTVYSTVAVIVSHRNTAVLGYKLLCSSQHPCIHVNMPLLMHTHRVKKVHVSAMVDQSSIGH